MEGKMSVSRAILAGLIQGFTEFLPVSSSGHLVIFASLFGGGEGGYLGFTVFLHLATLFAVIAVYIEDIWSLILTFFAIIKDLFHGKADFDGPDRKFLLMIIVATIPAVIAGLMIKLLNLESALENIFITACMLFVTAALMLFADRLREGRRVAANTTLRAALFIGLLQAFAILPGLSRSGSAIFGGSFIGLKKDFAVRFAFILSIPVVLGSVILELPDVLGAGGFDIAVAEPGDDTKSA